MGQAGKKQQELTRCLRIATRQPLTTAFLLTNPSPTLALSAGVATRAAVGR
jgi:hypothetical protein